MEPIVARPGFRGPCLKPLLLAVLVVLGSILLVNGVLYAVKQDFALYALKTYLLGTVGADSWMPMRVASEWLAQAHAGTLYQEVFFGQSIKFQYPPSSLLLFSALETLGIATRDALFNAIGWFAVLVTAAAVAAQSLLMLRQSAAMKPDFITAGCAAGLAVLVTLTFYPVLKSYTLGQAQTWLNAGFALAVVCWLLERRLLAGLLVGLICMIKPQFGVFLVWGLLRRQWRFIAGIAAVGVPLTILAVILYGWSNHLDYLATLQFLGRHGESFYPNQSINGLLHRLLGNGEAVVWVKGAFPPYHPVVYYATMASSAVIVLAALFYRARENAGGLFDFLIAALSFTMASPVAWDHHYGILPPILAAIFLALCARAPSSRRALLFALLALSYGLTAQVYPITRGIPAGPASLIQSYLLFGALIALWLLYQVRGQPAADEARSARFGVERGAAV